MFVLPTGLSDQFYPVFLPAPIRIQGGGCYPIICCLGPYCPFSSWAVQESVNRRIYTVNYSERSVGLLCNLELCQISQKPGSGPGQQWLFLVQWPAMDQHRTAPSVTSLQPFVTPGSLTQYIQSYRIHGVSASIRGRIRKKIMGTVKGISIVESHEPFKPKLINLRGKNFSSILKTFWSIFLCWNNLFDNFRLSESAGI